MDARTKKDRSELISKVQENRSALRDVHNIVDSIEGRMEVIEATSKANSEAILVEKETMNASMVSLRNLGEQILNFLRSFPKEIRALLQGIMQADWRTYQAVLQIQEHLARSPTFLHDSNIRFTNALGEYRELPYEYFSHLEVCIPLPPDQVRPSNDLISWASRSRVSFEPNSSTNWGRPKSSMACFTLWILIMKDPLSRKRIGVKPFLRVQL